VTPVWGSLSGFSKTGIVVDGGRNIDVDYVVLSTGFDLEVCAATPILDLRPN
jgi:hypothetical protein